MMKRLVLTWALSLSALGQSARPESFPITPAEGESWLNHLHRSFQETSMGKSYHLGPLLARGEKESPDPPQQWSRQSASQMVILHGSDLYRLNCWGCHGEFGLGVPPEINSVINPTRATSTQLVMERMKNRGMDMSRADAAQLANQAKAALLQRLHKGGTDMPAFSHLSEPEIRAIVNYLRQLAEIPGAEKQQAMVKESRVRAGEHLVKSTCHICHSAAGPNPDAQQLFDGVIPPLNTLTTRTNLLQFEQKIRRGAPIVMGTPPSASRGRMPVFDYLSEEEVADAYLYLKLYPPEPASVDVAVATVKRNQAASEIMPLEFRVEPTNVAPLVNARDTTTIIFPVAAEIFTALLLIGGLSFTFLEIRRLTVLSERRKLLVIGQERAAVLASRSEKQQVPHSASSDRVALETAEMDHAQALQHEDYRTFESSWLSRWLKEVDEAA